MADQCIVSKCDKCKAHEFQDLHYGNKMRVMNFSVKNSTKEKSVYRCTVCSTLHTK